MAINRTMESGITFLEQRNIPQASVDEQYVMTGANNLALMLNEVLQQLMQHRPNSKIRKGMDHAVNPEANHQEKW
ncbi:hypothetical protein EMGBS15_06920 [Filimonas sp.]|nr:hypothetical protein EMGBS15_06920 [Filimonas sp.]